MHAASRLSRRLATTLLLLLHSLLMAGCTAYPLGLDETPAAIDTRRLEAATYTPKSWPEPLQADVHLPVTANGTSLRPAALVVHGGGWQRRERADMDAIAERLAQRGYVAINIDYRFAPTYRFPAQLHDLQQAMHWINDQAERWRIDTDRIIGVGYSSGAHLISLLAVMNSDNPLDSPFGGPDTRLAGVLAGGTPTDLLRFDDGRLLTDFIGGTQAEYPDRYRQASPLHQLGDSAPPFFLFHGNLDGLVPIEQAEVFHAALNDRGIANTLYRLTLRGHYTTFLTAGPAIETGLDFLDRQLAPPPITAQSASGIMAIPPNR
ncbi:MULTISPECIES: alpha/beta hydrolase [Halomonadaceae]|uniref:alpha/beta hydrolase n=1 Tax=Halomonadaceae TaxID=28256 RepID=UPI00158302EE|nr:MULTISPECIES: alpha/beta hydrolase [Halomonas]MDI4636066.1 alpha/beta hydrolase [Halomonas sp. BMC7]NUJ60432.1 alpha/beta hydrolase [Halomonas taeanensis]